MKITYRGQEVQMNEKDLPTFSYQEQSGLDLTTLKGGSSTTFKFPASAPVRKHMGGVAMSEERDGGGELRIGLAGEAYHIAQVRPAETDRGEHRLRAVSGNSSWMDTLKNVKINTLDLGETGEIAAAMQEATWTDEESVLIFPVIDYGWLEGRAAGISDVPPWRIRPGVRVWHILRKAFAQAGYALTTEGSLGRYWKKLFLPNVVVDIPVALSELPPLTANLSLATPWDAMPEFTAAPGSTTFDLPLDTVVNDPSGSAAPLGSSYKFTAPATGTYKVEFSITATYQYPYTQPVPRTFIAYVRRIIGANFPILIWHGTAPDSALHTYTWRGLISPLDLVLGEEYAVAVQFQNFGDPTTFTFDECTVDYTPLSLPYQAGYSFQVAPSLPDMSAMDLLKNISALLFLTQQTDERTKKVTLRAYDDRIRPIVEGIDMSTRADHTRPPVRVRPVRPSQVKFRMGSDTGDQKLKLLEGALVPYGGLDLFNDQSTGNPESVSVGFAPTVNGATMETLLTPVMRKDGGAYQVDDYKRTARLLIHDGVKPAEWLLDGIAKDVYPNCYWAQQGERFNLAFGRETYFGDTGPGTIDRFGRTRLHRYFNSDILRIYLRLFDDELMDIDFGVPRLVHDRHEKSWYIFEKISQKRFGLDQTTLCDIVQYFPLPSGPLGTGQVLVVEPPEEPPCEPTVTMVTAGDAPAFVALDVAVGKAFVTNAESDNITVIDSDTDAVIATIASGANANPWGALVDPSTGLLYVANINVDTVSVFDTTTHALVTTINVSDRPFTFALNSSTGMLYVLTESNTPSGAIVEVIDTSTNTVVATVTVAPVGGFVSGSGLVVNEALNKVYMAGREGTDVYVIDGTTDTVVATIPVTATAIRNKEMALHIGLNKLYVLTKTDNVLTVIDCTTDTITTTIPYAFDIDQVAVNQNNDEVYVRLPNSADIIDANTDTVVGSIAGVGDGDVAWIAVDHANDVLYFYGDAASNTIKTYDANTHALRDEFSFTGTYAANMAVDPVRRKIYASVIGSDTVAVCQECFEDVPGNCDGEYLQFVSTAEIITLESSRSTTGYITIANSAGQVTLGDGDPGAIIDGESLQIVGETHPFCLWSSDAEGTPSGNLTELRLANQGLISASGQDADASLLLVKNLSDNALDATSVDHILNSLDAALSEGSVDLSGGTNATPTAASDANVALLLANDWTVTTN